MITSFLNDSHTTIVIVGVWIIIVLGAFAWAVMQIYKFLNNQFVLKLDCERCINNVRKDFAKEMNERYNSVQNKIDDLKHSFDKKIDIMHDAAEKRSEAIVRIETKLDLLLRKDFKNEE